MKLELSKSECEAVMDYIWDHSRASPNGKAYKVWQKMWDFVTDPQRELNFKAAKSADAIDFFAENGIDIS